MSHLKPFEQGFTRELVLSYQQKDKFRVVTYYRTPGPKGKRLRSLPEVQAFLTKENIQNLTVDDFNFAQHPIHEPPGEIKVWAMPNKGKPTSSPKPWGVKSETDDGSTSSAGEETGASSSPKSNPISTDSIKKEIDDSPIETIAHDPIVNIKVEDSSDYTADQLVMMQAYGFNPEDGNPPKQGQEPVIEHLSVQSEPVVSNLTDPDFFKSESNGASKKLLSPLEEIKLINDETEYMKIEISKLSKYNKYDLEYLTLKRKLTSNLYNLKLIDCKENSNIQAQIKISVKLAQDCLDKLDNKTSTEGQSDDDQNGNTSSIREQKSEVVEEASKQYDRCECHCCGAQFNSLTLLQDHHLEQHSLYMCFCGDTFKAESSLGNHRDNCASAKEKVQDKGLKRRLVKEEEPKLRTSERSKRLRRSTTEPNTSGIVQKGQKCIICAMAFPSEESLKEHLWSVHNIGEPFRCKNCEKEFRWAHESEEHEKDCPPLITDKKKKSSKERMLDQLLKEAERVAAVTSSKKTGSDKADVSYKENSEDDFDDSDRDQDYDPSAEAVTTTRSSRQRSSLVSKNIKAAGVKKVDKKSRNSESPKTTSPPATNKKKNVITKSSPKEITNLAKLSMKVQVQMKKIPVDKSSKRVKESNSSNKSEENQSANEEGFDIPTGKNKTETIVIGTSEKKVQLPIRLKKNKNKSSDPDVRKMQGIGNQGKPEWVKVVGKTVNGESTYQCFYCDETKTVPKLVVAHMTETHSELKETIGDEGDSVKGRGRDSFIFMSCRHCNYISVQRTVLWQHLIEEHGVTDILQPFEFEVDRKNLNNFDQKVKFFCTEQRCGYSVHQKQQIVEHVKSRHLSSQCIQPGYILVEKAKVTPTGQEEQRMEAYMCEVCQFVAFKPHLIKSHCIETHAQKFLLCQCDDCGEQFMTTLPAALSSHFTENHPDARRASVSVSVVNSDGQEDHVLFPLSRSNEQSVTGLKEKPSKTSAAKRAKSELEIKFDKMRKQLKKEISDKASSKK